MCAVDASGNTALFEVAIVDCNCFRKAHLEVMKVLVGAGANIDQIETETRDRSNIIDWCYFDT